MGTAHAYVLGIPQSATERLPTEHAIETARGWRRSTARGGDAVSRRRNREAGPQEYASSTRGTLAPCPPVAEPAPSAVARSPSSPGGTRATTRPAPGNTANSPHVRAPAARRGPARNSPPWTATWCPTSRGNFPCSRGASRRRQFPATDFTATDTGAGPLISSSVRPAVAGVSTSSASTAATSSRGIGPRPVCASRRTRPVPASSVS